MMINTSKIFVVYAKTPMMTSARLEGGYRLAPTLIKLIIKIIKTRNTGMWIFSSSHIIKMQPSL